MESKRVEKLQESTLPRFDYCSFVRMSYCVCEVHVSILAVLSATEASLRKPYSLDLPGLLNRKIANGISKKRYELRCQR